MLEVPDAEILAVEVMDNSVVGVSVWPGGGREAMAVMDGQEEEREFHVWPNTQLPMRVRLNVDADGFVFRVLDPLGTPVLEWRFEVRDV